MKNRLPKFPVPVWAAAIFTALWCEGLLHLWTAQSLDPTRFATVLVFALGLGGFLGQLLALLGGKRWSKWVSTGVLVLMVAFYLVSFFVWQFFQTFMSPATMLKGAGGVATGFAGDAVATALAGWWRILLMLLPPVLYGLLACPVRSYWRTRYFLLAGSLLVYGLGFGLVYSRPADAARLGETYQYESAVNAFGLHVAAALDLRGGPQIEEEGFLQLPPQSQPETLPQTTEPLPEPEPGEVPQTLPEPVVYEPNVMDLDFDALAQEAGNSRIAQLHQYVGSLEPTMKNQYTGLFAGKNLIFITAEAFAKEVIDPELTPTLYRLANEGIRFDKFYQPKWGAGTTSGEFSNLTGIVPTSGGSCMMEPGQQNMFLLLGKQMQKLGYTTAAYHNNDYKFYNRHKTHPNLGYDIFMGYGNGMEKGVTGVWPQSDLEMMEYTIPMHLQDTPFHLYYMSVSGHSVYTVNGNAMSKKNYEEVNAFAQAKGKTWSEPVKCYMAANLELEKAMAYTVQALEEAGILEDTVIVISPDHFPYGLENTKSTAGFQNCLEELYGSIPKSEHDHNALIIWSPCVEDLDIVVEDPVYSLDILPTLSNLFGLDYDSRLLVGRDVLSTAEPLVLWPNFCWMTDRGYYDSSTATFTPAPGAEPVDAAYLQRIKAQVQNKLHYSNQVIEMDYFKYFPEP